MDAPHSPPPLKIKTNKKHLPLSLPVPSLHSTQAACPQANLPPGVCPREARGLSLAHASISKPKERVWKGAWEGGQTTWRQTRGQSDGQCPKGTGINW